MITIEDLGRMADEYAKEIAPDNKEEQTAISADSLGFLNKVMEKCFLVEKSKVQELYNSYCAERDKEEPGSNRSSLGGRIAMLQELFGSKCLPDEQSSVPSTKSNVPSSEPKFKMGDKVKNIANPHDDGIYRIDDIKKSSDGFIYHIQGLIGISNVKESDLEPYTEPEDLDKRSSTWTDDCPSPGKEASQLKPITSKVSVYLATKEEDEAFRQLLHENGFKWNSTDLLIDISMWESDIESAKIHFAHPDKTVTFEGDRTSDTLTLSEFKKRYFEEETSPNVNHSDINIDELVATGCVPDPAKHFDTILKDIFRNERRLNIATQMVKAIMQCPGIVERIASAEVDSLLDDILHDVLYLTDRLMSVCEKGGMK